MRAIRDIVIDVKVLDDQSVAILADGRTCDSARKISTPNEGIHRQRTNWRLRGGGHGIHWPDLDGDVSAAILLLESC